MIGGVGDTLPLPLASLLGGHLTLLMAMTLLRARLEPGYLGHESSSSSCWPVGLAGSCSCQSSCPPCLEVVKMSLK